MAKLIVTMRDGTQRTLHAEPGLSVMEIIRDGGIDDILALCGGSRSCATCHVKLDPEFLNKVGPIGEEESDLLDSSDHRDATSRLSCQIPFTSELDGLRVTIVAQE
jgi:2Fe-2S ferredoxin